MNIAKIKNIITPFISYRTNSIVRGLDRDFFLRRFFKQLPTSLSVFAIRQNSPNSKELIRNASTSCMFGSLNFNARSR